MALSLKQEREQAHALLDLLPPVKLTIVRYMLNIMVNDEELTVDDRDAIQAGLNSIDSNVDLTIEDLLSDFGLTMSDFENLGEKPERSPFTPGQGPRDAGGGKARGSASGRS